MTVLTDAQALNVIRALDAIDGEIEVLQSSKADLLADTRGGMAGETKAEISRHIAAIKVAAKKLRKARMKPEAAEADEARDELAEHYVALASRDTRVHTHEEPVSWDAARAASRAA
jgi:cysteinyl-tRNA synthetase